MDGDNEITTTIIVNKAQLDTIIIALNDSKYSCQERIKWANRMSELTYNQYLEMDAEDGEAIIPKEKFQEVIESTRGLAQFALDQIPSIMTEIKEVYPELEDREEKANKIIIPKPGWNS